MSMPFVMPISLVVTFLLQADSFTISPDSLEDKKGMQGRHVPLCPRDARLCKLCSQGAQACCELRAVR